MDQPLERTVALGFQKFQRGNCHPGFYGELFLAPSLCETQPLEPLPNLAGKDDRIPLIKSSYFVHKG